MVFLYCKEKSAERERDATRYKGGPAGLTKSTPSVAIAKLIVSWRCTVLLHDYVLLVLYMCITALVLSCIIFGPRTHRIQGTFSF
jgi:hypothetical protein